MLETQPKEFFGRRVKSTPDIVVKLITRALDGNRDSLDLNDE